MEEDKLVPRFVHAEGTRKERNCFPVTFAHFQEQRPCFCYLTRKTNTNKRLGLALFTSLVEGTEEEGKDRRVERTVRTGITRPFHSAQPSQGTKGLLRSASICDFVIVQAPVLLNKDGNEILVIGSDTGQYKYMGTPLYMLSMQGTY